jgi:hypothetical protein
LNEVLRLSEVERLLAKVRRRVEQLLKKPEHLKK